MPGDARQAPPNAFLAVPSTVPATRLAVEAVRAAGGGVVVVADGRVALPVAGLLSDGYATEIAAEMRRLKEAWTARGCTLPCMGFNLIPPAVIPEIRITDRGLVTVPGMEMLPLILAA